MYTQRIVRVPAVGKTGDLRAAMLERTKAASSTVPHSLSARMFSPEPAFIHLSRFESLAALEASQERNQTDPAFQDIMRRIDQCLYRPAASELYEVLVPRQGSGAAKFSLGIKQFPAAGKGPETRRLLEERVRKTIPGRIGALLSTQVAPPDGPAFVVTHLFANLAGLEEFRGANQQEASFLTQLAALSARPNQQELARVLVPYPAR